MGDLPLGIEGEAQVARAVARVGDTGRGWWGIREARGIWGAWGVRGGRIFAPGGGLVGRLIQLTLEGLPGGGGDLMEVLDGADEFLAQVGGVGGGEVVADFGDPVTNGALRDAEVLGDGGGAQAVTVEGEGALRQGVEAGGGGEGGGGHGGRSFQMEGCGRDSITRGSVRCGGGARKRS